MPINLKSPLSQCVSQSQTTPTGGTTKGLFVSLQDTDGFYFSAADETQENEDIVTIITQAPKVRVVIATGSGADIQEGEYVYYDSGNDKATTESTGNTLCLIAQEPGSAADSDGAVLFEFDGKTAFLKV